MTAYPVPTDEAERLAALHALALLDTPREPQLDRLAQAAARIFRVPIAVIGLIDADRQWYKACIGVDADEVPRELSFCNHAIMQDGAFVVEDTHEDPLFATHPMVVGGPLLRFYAGWPLHGPSGHKIGTLCVADARPHRLSEDDRLVLQELAGLVESELGSALRADAAVAIARRQEALIADGQRLDTMRSRFLSMVSHDLKNPLGSLALSLAMLRDALQPGIDEEGLDDARFSIDMALRSVRRLVRLADGLLDFERMDAGATALAREPVEVAGVFADAIGSVTGSAQAAGVRLVVGDAPGVVAGDRDRLIQVFTNLVGNAVKFSPRGAAVTLSAAVDGDALALRVDDEGRGIPPAMLEAIFERFTQVEADDARVHGGSGLGLAICRSIVRQHGGTIRAENRPSGGARFEVRLPLPAGD